MSEEIEINETGGHSTKSMISFATVNFGLRSVPNIIVQYFTFFYETEILFPIGLMTIAIVIYTIWDMFNDPLAGHFTDKNYSFTRKWGRRFPWIIVSSIAMFFAFILFFMPPDPQVYVWATFFWFLIMFMAFDGLLSLATVAYQSLLPNKYRPTKERLKVSGLTEAISAVGLVLSFLLPPMIIEYGNPSSYIVMAIISGILLLISLFLGIPGIREEKELIDRYYLEEEKEPFFKEFFKMFKVSLKQKNFRAIIYHFIAVSIFNMLFVASIPYYVAFVLNETADFQTVILLPYIIMIIFPIPLYYWVVKKLGHYKVIVYASFVLPTFIILMLIFNASLIMILIFVGAMSVCLGLLSIAFVPLYSDFFDEAAVLNKKRQEGFYNGFQTFFGRTIFIFQLVVFWIIHELTGFDPAATTQTPLAQTGIIIHWLLIPGIALYIGIILFVRIWDLKPDRVEEIKRQLKELNI